MRIGYTLADCLLHIICDGISAIARTQHAIRLYWMHFGLTSGDHETMHSRLKGIRAILLAYYPTGMLPKSFRHANRRLGFKWKTHWNTNFLEFIRKCDDFSCGIKLKSVQIKTYVQASQLKIASDIVHNKLKYII